MMKKHVKYRADVIVAQDGGVVGCECECAAGAGPNAHCKHVVAVMCSLVHLQTKGVLNLRKTCTQQLQAFHKPSKEYFGTPLKTEDLPQGSYNRSEKVNFDPIDPQTIDKKEYNQRVRNLSVGYCATNKSTMTLMHAYMPANLYASNKDHSYAGDPEEIILEYYKMKNVSALVVEEIEVATRQQFECELWHDIRNTHLTTSNFYQICHAVTEEAKFNLAKRLLNPKPFTNKYVQHGRDCEPKAIRIYDSMLPDGFGCKECGFFLCKEYPFLGGTPDRVLPLSVVEVKCPYNQRHMLISEDTIPFLVKNSLGQLALKEDHQYYYQIQGQMFVANKPYANLVVYTFKDLKIIDVPRDGEFISQMVAKLEIFYENYFKPLFFEKYLY